MSDMYTDSEHSDTESAQEEENEPIATFNLFDYISNSPTVIGINNDAFTDSKYKEILWDAYLQHKNKLENILEVLFTMNSIQRNLVIKTWTSRRDGGGTDLQSVLKDFFSDLKNEELSLRLLYGMLKNLDELDAEWIHDALYDSNDSTYNDELIIEIICTRTYKQLKELTVSYKKRYNKELLRDIKLKYRKIDANFVNMATNLINGERDENVLIKPEIDDLTADVKFIHDALQQNKIPKAVLEKLGYKLTRRSWRHIHDLCPVYAQLVGYNLQTSLVHKLSHNGNRLPSNIAMINIVEISRSIHFYFAHRLAQCLSSKSSLMKVLSLHRIVLSRCEIDLGAILLLFASKTNLCDNKTIKQWITEKIPRKKQPIHQKILLFLCGLPQNDDIKEMEMEIEDEKDDVYYALNYDEYIGSVTGVQNAQFKPELDVQSIMNWIHPIQDGEATKEERKKLKDRMAKLLCNRNSIQREKINKIFRAKHKSNIIDYLSLIIKKGSSLKICGYLLQTITGCNCMKIRECIDDKNINGICDILCTNSPPDLREIVESYSKKYGSNLMQELEDTCNRLKKNTLWRIWNTLLSNRRFQNYHKNSSVNMRKLKKDLKFLTNFKKSKFKNLKDDSKKRLVDIFCENSKVYLRALNIQFQQRSHDYNLMYLLDKVLGIKSGSGYAIKVILEYSINQSEYFAKQIHDLGRKNWKKYEVEMGFLFISRSEIDLQSIQLAFHNNLYAEGKILTQWVSEKTNESKTGLFLVLLLQSFAAAKNPEQQTRDTLRAISASAFSKVYTARTPNTPQTSEHSEGLILGWGELHLTKRMKTVQLSPNISTTEEFHIDHDVYSPIVAVVDDVSSQSKSKKRTESSSKSKQSKQFEEKKETETPPPKAYDVKHHYKATKVEKVANKAVAVAVVNQPVLAGTKMKKLSESSRREMSKKIINTLTKKVKLSDIDIKDKNNKIEPDELFDFLTRKKIMVPRYISNVVFSDIDINGDGHITMFEYFKWKSKISVVKMFDILPEKVPDIDDDDAYYFEEGIPSHSPTPKAKKTQQIEAKPQQIEAKTDNEPDDELRILEEKLILYKKLLNFKEFKQNKNNETLNRNVFQAYCKRNDFGLNKQQIYRIFDDMDYDKDGKISPSEYFKWRNKISMGYLTDLLAKNSKIITPKIIKMEIKEQEIKIDNNDVKVLKVNKNKNELPVINKNDLKEFISPYSKSDYSKLKTQITILVDENRKKWSLYLLNCNDENAFSAKLSFLEFVKQHLSDRIVTQLFKRFGVNNIVGSDGFVELLTFTYTLYTAKLQREFYNSTKGDNSFKKMKSSEVRPKIEHFVIWVVRTFGKELRNKEQTICIENPRDKEADEIEVGEYKEYEFELKKDSYSSDLAVYINEYINKEAEHEDIETAWMVLMIWLE